MKRNINIKEGYKKTAVGVIPNEWEVKKLEQLVSIQNGRGYSHLEKGDIPVYASGGIINYVNEHLYEGTSIGIGRKGTIDNPQLLTGKYWVIDTLFFMNNFKDIYPYFLYSKFKTIIWYKYNETSGLPSLIKNTIQKIQLAIPPLPEQQAIANCLTTWDRGIEKLTQLIATKREQKKGLMQQLLTGKKRLDGFVGEWKRVKIGSFSIEKTSKNVENKDIEVLSCTKYDGLVPSLEYFGRKVFGDDLSKYKVVPKGYFAYATNHIEEGSIGYQNIRDKGLVSPMYTVFKTNQEIINDVFLFMLLKSHKLIHEYNKRMEGSIDRRGGLRWKNFKSIKINIPSIKEQTAIAHILTTADQEIALLEKKLEAMKEEKKGLMQGLLTGEKRLVESC